MLRVWSTYVPELRIHRCPAPATQISQSASWRYAHHNSFTLLSSPEDTKLDLEAAHNLPIEPLFVSDMAVAAADTSAAVDSS